MKNGYYAVEQFFFRTIKRGYKHKKEKYEHLMKFFKDQTTLANFLKNSTEFYTREYTTTF